MYSSGDNINEFTILLLIILLQMVRDWLFENEHTLKIHYMIQPFLWIHYIFQAELICAYNILLKKVISLSILYQTL